MSKPKRRKGKAPSNKTKKAKASSKEAKVSSKEAEASSKEAEASIKDGEPSKEAETSKEADASSKEEEISIKEAEASSKESLVSSKEAEASSKEALVSSKEAEASIKENGETSSLAESTVISHRSHQKEPGEVFVHSCSYSQCNPEICCYLWKVKFFFFVNAVQVMVMGQGDTGQLGLGEDIMEKKKPSPVGGALTGLQVVQVVCGGMHTAALTDDGKVWRSSYLIPKECIQKGRGEEREG